MIICVCNNISHSTVEQYTSLGVNSLNELQEHISISNKCRKCETCVVSMLAQNQFVPQCDLSIANVGGNINKMDIKVVQFHYDKELNPLNDPYPQVVHQESINLEAINDISFDENQLSSNIETKPARKMKM